MTRIVTTCVSLLAAMVLVSPGVRAREVESLQPLLLQALEHGSSQGTITGPIAETFARLFRTSHPLQFKVRRIRMLTPDCGRLEVTATQAGVFDRSSTRVSEAPQDRSLTYEVSMCSDGSPYSGPRQRPNR